MARFRTILTDRGSDALTLAMWKKETVFPDFIVAGKGILGGSNEDKAALQALLEPVDVDIQIMDRIFEKTDGENPSRLIIATQVSNLGLTEVTPIRELFLYANTNGGDDLSNAIPFAYAWYDEEYAEDTDNILPPPLEVGIADTLHFHEMELFVTNQEMAHIEVKVSLNGFVTHRYLNEILETGGIELSDNETPLVGTALHLRIRETIPYLPGEAPELQEPTEPEGVA